MGSQKTQDALALQLDRQERELVVLAPGELSDKQLASIMRETFDFEERPRGVIVVDEGGGDATAAAAYRYRYIGHIWLPKRLRSYHLWQCIKLANANHYGRLIAAALE